MYECVGIYVSIVACAFVCTRVRVHALTFQIDAHSQPARHKCQAPLHTCMRLRGAIRWERVARGFPARKSAALNHMSTEGGSFGSRPGLEGNQQHVNRILGKKGKEIKQR